MIVISIILNYANMGTLALHSPSCFKFLASELRIKSKLIRIRLGTQQKSEAKKTAVAVEVRR